MCPHHSCPAIVEPWIIFFSGYSYSIKFHITFSPAPTIEESHNIFHTKLLLEEILPIINRFIDSSTCQSSVSRHSSHFRHEASFLLTNYFYLQLITISSSSEDLCTTETFTLPLPPPPENKASLLGVTLYLVLQNTFD